MRGSRWLNSKLAHANVYTGMGNPQISLQRPIEDLIIGNQGRGPKERKICGYSACYIGQEGHELALKFLTTPSGGLDLDSTPVNLGWKLRALRQFCNVNDWEICKVMGVSRDQLDQMEREDNAYALSVCHLCRLANFYGVSLSTLLTNVAKNNLWE